MFRLPCYIGPYFGRLPISCRHPFFGGLGLRVQEFRVLVVESTTPRFFGFWGLDDFQSVSVIKFQPRRPQNPTNAQIECC